MKATQNVADTTTTMCTRVVKRKRKVQTKTIIMIMMNDENVISIKKISSHTSEAGEII